MVVDGGVALVTVGDAADPGLRGRHGAIGHGPMVVVGSGRGPADGSAAGGRGRARIGLDPAPETLVWASGRAATLVAMEDRTPEVGAPDPASFYTGLVAELYRHLRSADPDPEPYARFVEVSGEPALELGCGDGDPLLDLRARGLDVEGLDASLDMVERCRRAAGDRGLDVVVHHASFESMDLGRRYRSIYLAGPTFNLRPDDETARRALERIRAHLEPGGSALVPLFVPEPVPPGDIGSSRQAVGPDGATMRVTVVSADRDVAERRQTTVLRYELVRDDEAQVVERPWLLHWFEQDRFARLAADAGLSVHAVLAPDGTAAAPDADTFVYWLGAPSR